MLSKRTICLAFIVVIFTACKKNYKCNCTNSNGTYFGGEIEGTKRQAQKQCTKLAPSPATTCELE